MGKPDGEGGREIPAAPLDEHQEGVLRALLDLECRISPGEFETLWLYAKRHDFRLEEDRNGPLRKALAL